MTRNIITAFFLFPVTFLFASHDETPAGARAYGMGGTSLGLSDVWAVHNNQAAMAFIGKPAFGADAENSFLIRELNRYTIAAVLPTRAGVLGISASFYGNKFYSEGKTGLSYAKSFGKRISAGVQLDYLFVHLAESYGTKHLFTCEVGLLGKVTRKLILATHVFNPLNAKLSAFNGERIPAMIRFGLQYHFFDGLLASVEVEEKFSYRPSLRAGVEYRLLKWSFFRAGVAIGDYAVCSLGVGLLMKWFALDMAASYHPVLGISQKLSVTLYLKNRGRE